jgi:hypothetical protein
MSAFGDKYMPGVLSSNQPNKYKRVAITNSRFTEEAPMPESDGKGVGYINRLWLRLKNKIVEEAPEEYRWCEFDCEKLQCSMGDWENCETRLHSKAQTQEQS